MAKLDKYVIALGVGSTQAKVNLEITLLFEDGDNEATVIASASKLLRDEVNRMRSEDYFTDIEN